MARVEREEKVLADEQIDLARSALADMRELIVACKTDFGMDESDPEERAAFNDWSQGEALTIESLASTSKLFTALEEDLNFVKVSKVRWNSSARRLDFPSEQVRGEYLRRFSELNVIGEAMNKAKDAEDDWWKKGPKK